MRSVLFAVVLFLSLPNAAIAQDGGPAFPNYLEVWEAWAAAHAGGGNVSSDTSVDYDESFVAPINVSPDDEGFAGGLSLGVAVKPAPGLILGIEASHTFSNISATETVPTLDTAGIQIEGDTTTVKQDLNSMTRLNFLAGFTEGNWQVAAKGGPAWANVTHSASGFDPDSGIAVSGSDRSTVSGYTVGAEIVYEFENSPFAVSVEGFHYSFSSAGAADLFAGLNSSANSRADNVSGEFLLVGSRVKF